MAKAARKFCVRRFSLPGFALDWTLSRASPRQSRCWLRTEEKKGSREGRPHPVRNLIALVRKSGMTINLYGLCHRALIL